MMLHNCVTWKHFRRNLEAVAVVLLTCIERCFHYFVHSIYINESGLNHINTYLYNYLYKVLLQDCWIRPHQFQAGLPNKHMHTRTHTLPLTTSEYSLVSTRGIRLIERSMNSQTLRRAASNNLRLGSNLISLSSRIRCSTKPECSQAPSDRYTRQKDSKI